MVDDNDSKSITSIGLNSAINTKTKTAVRKNLQPRGNTGNSILSSSDHSDYTLKSKLDKNGKVVLESIRNFDDMTLSSGQSCILASITTKHITLKEAIYEIEKNAKNDMPPPDYVIPSLGEIPIELFQWNKKRPLPLPKPLPEKYKYKKFFSNRVSKQHKLKYVNRRLKQLDDLSACIANNQPLKDESQHELDDISVFSECSHGELSISASSYSSESGSPNNKMRMLPAISERSMNIIGCQQPVELILAKANERSRTRKMKLEKVAEIAILKQQQILNSIEDRSTIQERMRLKLEKENKQKMLLKFMLMTQYMNGIKDIQTKRRRRLKAKFKQFVHYIIWYKRHVVQKSAKLKEIANSKGKVYATISNLDIRLRLAYYINITVRVRRKAVGIVIPFLHEARKCSKVTLTVRHYLQRLRKAKSVMRAFVACRRERINLLLSLFNKIEAAYIKVY